jgi:hypothetical protein
MGSENALWFSLLTILLIGLLLLLRVRWTRLSRCWDTVALTIGAMMFFSLCHFFLSHGSP